MKPLLSLLLLTLLLMSASAQAPARRWTGGSRFEATLLQTIGNTMLVRTIPEPTIPEPRVLLLSIPQPLLLPDGSSLRVAINPASMRTVQYTDAHGALRTVDAVVATSVRHVKR